MSSRLNPLVSPRLFGLEDQRLDMVATAALLALVITWRLLAFPVSIWELDEAYFAASLMHFNPTDNLPHPPWFPLWIAIGKAVHLSGISAARSLQLVSAVFSVWILFPLTALWATVLPRRLAVGAAVIFLVAPGPWFFSGRAFCGTTATALLAAALAFWLGAEDRTRWLTAGSVTAALAVLVRPHFLPAVVGAMAVLCARRSNDRRRIIISFVIPVLFGTTVFVVVAGGPDPLWSALTNHLEYHFSRLGQVEHGFADSGFARSLGHPVVAAAWIGFSLLGLGCGLRKGHLGSLAPVVAGALMPLVAVIIGLSNPSHARYAIPLLALTSGLAVFGLSIVFRRMVHAAIGSMVLLAAILVSPQLVEYRSAVSPPIAAIDEAVRLAEQSDGVLVADRTLYPFFLLRRLTRPVPVPVLFDHMIERGHTMPPPSDSTVYVYDAANPNLMVSSLRQQPITCAIPLVRTLGQGRYLDLSVAAGARLRDHPPSNP